MERGGGLKMISHSDPVCEFFTNCNVSIIVDIEWRGPKSSPTPFPSGRIVFVCLWGGWGWEGGGRNGDRAKKREREREDRSERRYHKSKGSSMVQDQLRFFRIFVGVEWSKRPMEELLGIPKSNLMAGGCVGFGVSLC